MFRPERMRHETDAQDLVWLRRTPHPVIVAIRDNRDYIRVLLYSYYPTITGWGVLLMCGTHHKSQEVWKFDILSVIQDFVFQQHEPVLNSCSRCWGGSKVSSILFGDAVVPNIE